MCRPGDETGRESDTEFTDLLAAEAREAFDSGDRLFGRLVSLCDESGDYAIRAAIAVEREGWRLAHMAMNDDLTFLVFRRAQRVSPRLSGRN